MMMPEYDKRQSVRMSIFIFLSVFFVVVFFFFQMPVRLIPLNSELPRLLSHSIKISFHGGGLRMSWRKEAAL